MGEFKDGVYTFEKGVKITLSKPSVVAVEGVQKRIRIDDPEPQPPTVWSEEKVRDDPNPQDPSYITEHVAWSNRTGMRVIDTLYLTGSKIAETGEDLLTPDSQEFLDWLDAIGVGLTEKEAQNKLTRYLAWLKYYVATDVEFAQCGTELLKLAGVAEEHIKEAEESFRNFALGALNQRSSS